MWGAVIGDIVGSKYEFDLSPSVDQILPDYEFNEICQTTIPEAVTCALESTSYEDAIRNAISISGDADILGAIAEAMHGIPGEFITAARNAYLSEAQNIAETLDRMYAVA